MRILYLHQYFNTPEMPGGTRSYEMARRLQAHGHDVHVVTSWREESDRKSWYTTKENGVTVHWLPIRYDNSMGPFRRVLAFSRFAAMSSLKAAQIKADIVFATSTPLTIAIPGAYAAAVQRIPMVFEVRDLWPEMPIAIGALRHPIAIRAARLLEKFAYNRSTEIVALSPGMRDGVIATGYPADRVTMIPNSADLDLFAGKDIKDPFLNNGSLINRKIALYAGTFGKLNNIDYLVDIANHLRTIKSSLAVVAVGSGSEKERIKRDARARGLLGEYFFLYNNMPKKDIVGAFVNSDIIISSFLNIAPMQKNSANKFFDGLAAGRPVAINYGGWQADLITRHDIGLVLPPADPHSAAQMLNDNVSDPDWLSRTGFNAKNLARERFDRDDLAHQLHDVLERATREYK